MQSDGKSSLLEAFLGVSLHRRHSAIRRPNCSVLSQSLDSRLRASAVPLQCAGRGNGHPPTSHRPDGTFMRGFAKVSGHNNVTRTRWRCIGCLRGHCSTLIRRPAQCYALPTCRYMIQRRCSQSAGRFAMPALQTAAACGVGCAIQRALLVHRCGRTVLRLQDEDSTAYGEPIVPESAVANAIRARTEAILQQVNTEGHAQRHPSAMRQQPSAWLYNIAVEHAALLVLPLRRYLSNAGCRRVAPSARSPS